LNPPRKIELSTDIPFRLEVERLKRVAADLAAAPKPHGVQRQRLGKRRRSCAVKDVYGVAPRSGMEGDRLDRMCAPGRGRLNHKFEL
jgi:hypothetical protein